MTADIWEPHVWQVGDRVRVRLSLECPRHSADSFHFNLLNGAVGVVLWAEDADTIFGWHRFAVNFPQYNRATWAMLASVELEDEDDVI